MRFKCTNCAGNDASFINNCYICKRCGFQISRENYEYENNEKREFKKRILDYIQTCFSNHFENHDEEINELKQEIERLKVEIDNSLVSSVKNILEEQKQSLEDLINEKIKVEPVIVEKTVKTLDLSLDNLIENAVDFRAIQVIAFLVRSMIEVALIKKFHIPHNGRNFIVEKQKYLELEKKYNINTYKKITHTPTGDLVEICPKMRFLMSNMDSETADKANNYWDCSNKFIHTNTQSIKSRFNNDINAMKKYWKEAVDFFKKHNFVEE